jgi:HEAT repeat protein
VSLKTERRKLYSSHNSETDQVGNDRRKVEVERLVQNLNSLTEGEKTVGKLMAYGRLAIEPLRRFLLEGRPSVVYQPRRWAVEVLAGLGAKDTLIEYLKRKKAIRDAAIRFGEEPVENAAARALCRWPTEDVFQILLEVSRRRSQLGLVEALGRFRRTQAIPYFIHALEDDICRSAAEEALRKLGAGASPALVEAALTRIPSPEEERPSSARRRTSALQVLSETELTGETWQSLRSLINDPHSGVVIAVCNIAAALGDHQDRVAAIRRLLEILPSADWFGGEEIGNCLTILYKDGSDILEAELAKRNSLPDEQRVMDRALRTLLRVKRQVAGTAKSRES